MADKVLSDNLSKVINDQFDNYNKVIRITDNYDFDMRKTINKIDLYRSSRFLTGESDSQGNRKYFFNILNGAAWTASKNLDLDIKDIKIVSKDGKDPLKAKLYSLAFHKWAKTNQFSKFLNKLTEFLPSYGWFVAKWVDGQVEYLPAKDVFIYPGVDNLNKSGYVIEEHKMQPKQIRGFNWNQKENIEEVIRIYNNTDEAQYIPIKEYSGVVSNQDIDEKYWNKGTDINGYSDIRGVSAMNLTYKTDDLNETISVSLTLHIENREGKKSIYKDVGYLDVDGRAMKLGIFELGFPFQERWNQIANEKNLAGKLASKQIFQTRGKTIEQNLMTDTDNGDILKVDAEVTRVDTGVRDLGYYQQEESNLLGLFRNLSNAQEVQTGENLPSGTPFRLGALLDQNSGKLFDFVREKMGIFIKEIMTDWLMPQFEKDMKKDGEMVLELLDEGLMEQLIERDINSRINKVVKKFVLANGRFPTDEERESAVVKLQEEYSKKDMFVKLTEDILDFEKDIDIIITGESINVTQKVETISNLTQLLAQNPGILQDPVTKRIFNTLLELTGLNPTDIGRPAQTAPQPSLNELGAGAAGPVGAPPVQ